MRAGILWICILTVAALLSVGCTRVLRMDPGGWGLEPTVSEDGLYRVPATEVGAAFLRPGARFADYRAVLIDPSKIPKDKVGFGCTVRVKDLTFQDEEEFTLVGAGEEDYDTCKILITRPIGQGLLGKKVGETVAIEVPKGVLKY